ncbi:MAG TPA: HAMP domain-containing sensor histidine kinase, partial [Pseudomonadales bacterium]|nr:HAMP domain-containing sensor histidine kinase [Pseudomonadales bacterium]
NSVDLNRMRRRLNQTWVEWAFIALLAGVCLVLSLLQYHWTGAVSRAEAGRLRAGMDEQAQQFCNAFDAALTESCDALVPDTETVNDKNRDIVHLLCFQQWQTLHLRPIFSRVAVIVPVSGKLVLYEQSLATGSLAPMQWPSGWAGLYAQLSNLDKLGPQPNQDPSGTFFIFPVANRNTVSEHSQSSPLRKGSASPAPSLNYNSESEWVLLELDTNYLRKTWLPGLTKAYLNSSGPLFYDVQVRTILPPNTVIFSSSSGAVKNSETPVIARFNRQGMDPEKLPGTAPDFRWGLEVRPRAGTLEALVADSRRRNLAVAIALTAMIFLAGLALVQLTRRSRRLAEAQMNFVAGVSHELRTPLTVIRGAGHNLLHGVASQPEQIEQYSKLIIQHAEQLAQMVEQVLELAGARKNLPATLQEPVSITEILRDAVSVTDHETENAGCSIHLELSPDLPAVIGDGPALRRVFQNLIVNAAKYGGQGGYIGITAVLDEEGREPAIEVQVADRGPGIPEDEVSEIFKPFFRGAAAQATQVRGSGLGLSLVREIVEAHGGTISVQSDSGAGAIFTVRLPVTRNK